MLTAGFWCKWKIGLNHASFPISCEMCYYPTGRNVRKRKKQSGQRSAWQYALCRRKISVLVSWNISSETWESQTR